MKSKLLALVTIGAIATTGITPAQAGPNDDLVKFLVGATIIGVLVNEANKANQAATVNRAPTTHVHRHHVQKPKVVRHAAIYPRKPNQCLRQRWTEYGWKTYYAKNCMKNRGWHRHDGLGWHKHY